MSGVFEDGETDSEYVEGCTLEDLDAERESKTDEDGESEADWEKEGDRDPETEVDGESEIGREEEEGSDGEVDSMWEAEGDEDGKLVETDVDGTETVDEEVLL